MTDNKDTMMENQGINAPMAQNNPVLDSEKTVSFSSGSQTIHPSNSQGTGSFPSFDSSKSLSDFRPKITVIGVGGGGCNAVNNMIRSQLEGVEFVVMNTDAQALLQSLAERRVHLGEALTKGLGAGSSPEIGRAAAEESYEHITKEIQGSNMVFIASGMGGGTGTGACPVIARAARDLGILTVAVVTKPFTFEGVSRMRVAEKGIEELQKNVDTIIVLPNQNLFRVANANTTVLDAFKMGDDVLYAGVRSITELMIMPGLINLDFADVRTVMKEMGKAMMGTGEAQGERRAIEAAEAAIANPLLDDVSIQGARAVLISITGGMDMTLFEVDEAANRIREELKSEDPNIIFGSTFEDDMSGKMRVSVVATGIDISEQKTQKNLLSARDYHQDPSTMPQSANQDQKNPGEAGEQGFDNGQSDAVHGAFQLKSFEEQQGQGGGALKKTRGFSRRAIQGACRTNLWIP